MAENDPRTGDHVVHDFVDRAPQVGVALVHEFRVAAVSHAGEVWHDYGDCEQKPAQPGNHGNGTVAPLLLAQEEPDAHRENGEA